MRAMTTSVSFTTYNSQLRLTSAAVTNDSPKQRFISVFVNEVIKSVQGFFHFSPKVPLNYRE